MAFLKEKKSGSEFADWRSRLPRLSIPIMIIVIGLGVILSAYFSTLGALHSRVRSETQNVMQTVLDDTFTRLDDWVERKYNLAEALAGRPEIQDAMLDLSRSGQIDHLPLESARELLRIPMRDHAAQEFSLITLDGLSSSLIYDESATPASSLFADEILIEDVRAGQTRLSLPHIYAAGPDGGNSREQLEAPTLSVVTGIYHRGELTGFLSIRFDPRMEFTSIFATGRTALTGETYAFDRDARLLSESRFTSQLIAVGLLEAGQSAILNVEIRDPAIDLSQANHPVLISENWPLTLMAQSATSGNNGANLDGYNDYRGVPVVGVWRWNTVHRIGVTTEVDFDEVYGPFNRAKAGILVMAVIAALLVLSTALVVLYLQRITARNSAEAAVTQRRTLDILNAAGGGLLGFDINGLATFSNPRAREILRCSLSEIEGMRIEALFGAPANPSAGFSIRSALEFAKVYRSVEPVFVNIEGTDIPIDFVATPILRGQNLEGVVVSFDDVSSRVAGHAERETLLVRLQESNLDLERFAYSASHDLKAPIRKIYGLSKALARNAGNVLTAQSLSILQHITESSSRMDELIGDLLSLSRVSADNVEQTTIELDPLLETVRENLSESIELSHASISCQNLPSTVIAHKARLMSLFQNLISNAIKYQSKGDKPAIVISCRNLPGMWEFRVRDNGIGIKVDDAERIFQPFTRLNAYIDYAGTGLGLTTCRKIVEAWGGKIWIDPAVLRGTEVAFTIPHSGVSNTAMASADAHS
jgi:signal transduction histidine kinase